ncbi:MAG TPA: OpcA/G6PD domain-containing protein [Candidatus Tumulicola sp.]
MTIDVRSLLDELTQRRQERDNAADVAMMTIVAFFEDETIGEWLRPRIAQVAGKQPSRVIVVDAARPANETSVNEAGDWIEVGADDCSPESLASAIGSLAHRSAPVALIWASFDMMGDQRFAALAERARTIVYNSSALERDENGLLALRSFAQSRPDASIADLAYMRLAPWQDAIALFFDAKNVIHELFDLRRVEIASGSDAEAYYLLGWLASRLEWNACGPREFCNRFGTEIAFRIERMPAPRRLQRVTLESSQTRFVAELESGSPSAIALSVTGAVQYPQRFRPVSNIGTPALIERAVSASQQDRVFFETLLAAGDILSREWGDR